jgi:hypothetical protein
MTTDKFDFEEDMMNLWHVVDDMKQLAAMVSDRNASSKDIAHVLEGLQVLYNDRFTQFVDEMHAVQDNIDTSWVESERTRKDNTVTNEMYDQYSITKKEIREQKTIENPKSYQIEDLKYNEKFLAAVEIMLKHYTVRSEWPKELKDSDE